jgi:hypothetical protein
MQRLLVVLTAVAAAHFAAAETAHDLSGYYGTEPATLGSWFGKLAIGGVEQPRLPQAMPGVDVRLVTSGQRIDGVDIKIAADSCAQVERHLAKLWGPPGDEGWLSKSGAQGARLEKSVDLDGSCELRFFRRVTPQQWLSWSRQSVVPLWAIGKPVAELETAISGFLPEHDDEDIRWRDTAIDGTHVALTASVRAKRVVGITVSTEMGSRSAPVWQRLRAMFGPPDSATTHEDSHRWEWRRALRIEVSTFVGDLPPTRPGTPPRIAPTPAMPRDPGFPLSIVFGG